jgi:hypothetical protein
VLSTVWFMWGGISDLRRLFIALHAVKRDARDDGFVVAGRNLDEADAAEAAALAAAVEPPSEPPQT